MSRYDDISGLLDSLGESATVEQVEYALRDHIAREVIAVLADRAAADGGAFNGGTITESLNVAGTNPAQPLLSGTAATGQATELVSLVNDDEGGGFFVNRFGGLGIDAFGSNVVIQASDDGGTFTAGSGTGLAIAGYNTEPLTISTGELVFWFDKTNGAAKLKIKAKQADGTVVTGEIALAP